MIVSIGTSSLKQARWYEYMLRFVLGGLVTATAGALGKLVGPSFAGLFLAFPAILAASTTLIAKHEQERKEDLGQSGETRGRQAAGADAFGAAIGSLGLVTFALLAWKLLPQHRAWLVLSLATVAWAIVSAAAWRIWKLHLTRRRPARS